MIASEFKCEKKENFPAAKMTQFFIVDGNYEGICEKNNHLNFEWNWKLIDFSYFCRKTGKFFQP